MAIVANADKRSMNLNEYPILACTGRFAFLSGPDDFSLADGRVVDSSRMFDPDVSPYCFHLANRNLLCVSTPDISDATFFYQAQRQHARSVIEIPFASLPERTEPPTLVYSIGRCGSTLLARALQAADVSVVSEPDYFTQAACHQPPDPALQRAIAGATSLLPYSVIKLRLECNHAPLLIAGAFRSPRIMFILRHPLDWAASLRRLSRNSLDLAWAVGQLRSSLLALDALTRNYPVRIVYYEDFRDLDPEYVAGVLDWLGEARTVSPEALRTVAAKDAQEGTIVSRTSVEGVPDDPGFRQAFEREWARQRPAELVARLSLRLL